MRLILPPKISQRTFAKALAAFAGIVGKEWVLQTDSDRDAYLDIYAPGNDTSHAPSAAVAPLTTEEIQAIIRVANEHKIPLWPISRGKNFGYGGSAPRMAGTVVLDLSRMKRIIEVNEELGYCVLEPGVGFFDLHEHLRSKNIPLWLALPGNAWGSVVGNALERGFSATPYGDHSASICGMEVVLPSSELVRTGMGAMSKSPTWPLFKHGFGPSWDQLFVQSNFGVVTKMGMWLMPEPQSAITLSMKLPNPEDLGWLIDVLTPLRIRGVIGHSVGITTYMSSATTTSERRQWYQGKDSIPDSVVRAIMEKYDVGWWNYSLRLYGDPEVNEAHRRIIQNAVAPHTQQEFRVARWNKGEPPKGAGLGAPAPSVAPLQMANWYGGRGGHLGFSPVMPSHGKLVLEQMQRTRNRYREFGMDFSSTFYVNGRHVTNINLIVYDLDDAEMNARVRKLFDALVADSAAAGYAEYRTHLSYMDAVAATFDFNDHALRRLNESVKDALDPNGILAPGKNGIWPRAYRDVRRPG
jgi:4-cresol dehydrogenase (hydroxylating) flavoprotein subunit